MSGLETADGQDALGRSVEEFCRVRAAVAPIGVSWAAQLAQLDQLVAMHPTYTRNILERETGSPSPT